MLGHRKFDLDDYRAILRRRWWLVVIPAALGPVLAYAASLVVVPRFVSTGLIFIDRPQVPEDVVKPMSTGDLIERIAEIQGLILSRDRLEPMVRKYDALPNNQVVSDEAVQGLRKAIAIAPAQFTDALTEGDRVPIPGLSISCTAGSANHAQEICSDIITMFIAQSREQTQQIEHGTTDFLSAQLDDAKRKLDEEDAKLAEFKSRNLGRLPDDQDTNLQRLTEQEAMLETAAEALDRATHERTYLQSLLQQQLRSWQETGAPISPGSPDDLQTQLVQAQELLAELEAKYTPDHPDVTRQKKIIADLKKQIADKVETRQDAANLPPSKLPETKGEPLQIQQLRAQIHEDEEIIRSRTAERDRLKAQIAGYERQLHLSPVIEGELKTLTRDHETALHFYTSLLDKKSQSDMEVQLERREQGERFRLLDPPNLPVSPDFPKKSLFLSGGLAGGIALGIALVLLLEALDNRIRDERDIEVLLKVQNLASLPAVESLRGWSRQKPKRGARTNVSVTPS